ncbi:MAG: hypothetical protein QF441_09715 [Bacteriovoracaceae bacterium]|jgi:hypothetical protein|nr:hypothetical protein [Bacteriovoracaceae bacterium]
MNCETNDDLLTEFETILRDGPLMTYQEVLNILKQIEEEFN